MIWQYIRVILGMGWIGVVVLAIAIAAIAIFLFVVRYLLDVYLGWRNGS